MKKKQDTTWKKSIVFNPIDFKIEVMKVSEAKVTEISTFVLGLKAREFDGLSATERVALAYARAFLEGIELAETLENEENELTVNESDYYDFLVGFPSQKPKSLRENAMRSLMSILEMCEASYDELYGDKDDAADDSQTEDEDDAAADSQTGDESSAFAEDDTANS